MWGGSEGFDFRWTLPKIIGVGFAAVVGLGVIGWLTNSGETEEDSPSVTTQQKKGAHRGHNHNHQKGPAKRSGLSATGPAKKEVSFEELIRTGAALKYSGNNSIIINNLHISRSIQRSTRGLRRNSSNA